MFIKTFYIFVAILSLSLYSNAQKCTDDNVYHKCDTSNSSIFTWSDMIISCPKDKICNLKNLMPTGTDCPPYCLPPADACLGTPVVTCDPADHTKFKLNDITFDCPSTFVCNDKQKYGCGPCYRQKCENPWTCGPNPEDVKTPQYEGKCLNGSVCRSDTYAPCDQICVNPNGKRSARALLQITNTF